MDEVRAEFQIPGERPVGPAELDLLRANGFTAWPSRLPIQPIFYPVMNERYAREIAERWNFPESGSGAVTAFEVPASLLDRYPVRRVGASHHEERWVPAEELESFNAQILGPIRVVATFP